MSILKMLSILHILSNGLRFFERNVLWKIYRASYYKTEVQLETLSAVPEAGQILWKQVI